MSKHDPVWRPYTQHQTMGDPLEIARGKAEYLYMNDGRHLLDLISSWWVNIHGHCHPVIANAIATQAATLEHVIFAGMNHAPAQQLAERLIEKLGDPFTHVFYSDNGSTAVEAALKMTIHEAINRGQSKRTKIIAFDGGFHGDTWAAMAAGKTSGFFRAYDDLPALEMIHVPFPETWDNDPDVEKKEHVALEKLESVLDSQGDQVASLIIEPLVQGASGMRMCRPEWLAQVVEKAKEKNVRVIFDEVMTGFGRTGKLFAFEHLAASVRPDLVCLSKGITGGFLPLSVTIVTTEVFESFLGDTFSEAFAHGHSYTANPISCAAALAGLSLFESEGTLARFAEIERIHRERLTDLPDTINHRVFGSIAACEMDGQENGYASSRSVELRHTFVEHGLLLRPLGATLYLMPPACVSAETLNAAYDKVCEILG